MVVRPRGVSSHCLNSQTGNVDQSHEVLISKASQTCNEGQYKMNYERVLEVKKEDFP